MMTRYGLDVLLYDEILREIYRRDNQIKSLTEEAENIAKTILSAYHQPDGIVFEEPIWVSFLKDENDADAVRMQVSEVRKNIVTVEVVTDLGTYAFCSLTQEGQSQLIKRMIKELDKTESED